MNKQAKLKNIIENLLSKGKTQFTREEIDTAIIKELYVSDQRSLDNWFRLMWKLEYFTQPSAGVYKLFFPNIQNLDITVDDGQECLDVNL